jgi:hypothetical protein
LAAFWDEVCHGLGRVGRARPGGSRAAGARNGADRGERERQEQMERVEQEVGAHLARRRVELVAEGVDDEDLEDKLSEEETDLRAEMAQEVEEELRMRLAEERRTRLSMIRDEVAREQGDN